MVIAAYGPKIARHSCVTYADFVVFVSDIDIEWSLEVYPWFFIVNTIMCI